MIDNDNLANILNSNQSVQFSSRLYFTYAIWYYTIK